MSNHVICVRVAQRALIPEGKGCDYNRFPFERIYLCKNNLISQLSKLYRYYITLPLDQYLLNALNRLAIHTQKETPIKRNDVKTTGQLSGGAKNIFNSYIKNYQDWTLLIPTHVKTKYKDKEKHKNPTGSQLGYVISKIIRYGHNAHVKMPRMTLHTPNRIIPLLCAVCKNNLGLHAGDCLPGRPSCASRVEISLKLDQHNVITSNSSILETGDIQ